MKHRIQKLLSYLGPGFITGASDDDPAGIGTYAQTGAQFGFQQLWTALFSFPLMVTIQEMCGRIGLIAGVGLVTVIKQHYSRTLLWCTIGLLLLANIINIGADLSAMAASAQLIIPFPYFLWLIIIVTVTIILEIFVTYVTYAQYLKYLAYTLLAYIVTTCFISLDWMYVFYSTFVPTIQFTKEYLINITAILGTTISPYLFFWQANQEVEERRANHISLATNEHISVLRIDTAFGMFFSNCIMWFIILTTGATLFKPGSNIIITAHEAARALEPIAGSYASLLFALGIFSTGLLAIPILAASVAYALCELYEWHEGLALTYRQGKAFYNCIAGIIVAGFLVSLLPINPIELLYYSAIINGILAPPLMIIILIIANDKKIMGNYCNGVISNIMGCAATIIMSILAIIILIFFMYECLYLGCWQYFFK